MQNNNNPSAYWFSGYLLDKSTPFSLASPDAFQLSTNNFMRESEEPSLASGSVSPYLPMHGSDKSSFASGSVSPYLHDTKHREPLYHHLGISAALDTFAPYGSCGAIIGPSRLQYMKHKSYGVIYPRSSRFHQVKVTCLDCGKQVSERNLKAHKDTHDPFRNSHVCGVCDKSYLHLRDLTDHRKNKHPYLASVANKHICGICGDSFTNNQELKNHRQAFLCFLFE